MTIVDNPELDQYEVPLRRAERTALAWRDEALALRRGIGPEVLEVETGAEALLAIRRVVAAQDRVDALLEDSRALMGRMRRARDDTRAAAEEQVDAAIANEAGRRIEYQGAADRRAAANVAAVEQRRAQRLLDRAYDTLKEAYDSISASRWQLNTLREDLRSTLNVFRFENSLDR
jgi:hypothetical protein